GMENGTAAVISASTGDASIYLTTGGGIIGGVGHERSSRAAIAFVREAGAHLSRLESVSSFPYPEPGHIIFYIRTANGVFAEYRMEDALASRRDDLWPLFYAGQVVVSELRRVSPDSGQ